jgi:predicted nucleic-acid-binding protein
MIGLDTNVLARFLVADDEAQAARARTYIERAIAAGETLYINRIVLAETVWILTKCYRQSRLVLADMIERILLAAEFEVEGKQLVWEALHEYRRGTSDFADTLIGAVNRSAGCSTTATFDKEAGKLKTFSLLE